jgi:hypothetical protein
MIIRSTRGDTGGLLTVRRSQPVSSQPAPMQVHINYILGILLLLHLALRRITYAVANQYSPYQRPRRFILPLVLFMLDPFKVSEKCRRTDLKVILAVESTGANVFVFCRLYPSFPQPSRQCLAPTCHLSTLN